MERGEGLEAHNRREEAQPKSSVSCRKLLWFQPQMESLFCQGSLGEKQKKLTGTGNIF
jgi:hypothetical protein